MKIELLDYAIENEGTTTVYADLSIMADGIGPIRWHLIPSEWNEEGGWVTFRSGIGSPCDEVDLSSISEEDRSLLFGERHDAEEIQGFEESVESALRERMMGIMSEFQEVFFAALDQQHQEQSELINGEAIDDCA